MENKFRSKTLVCGCCGLYFDTWIDYKDQDQDKGFGICARCQEQQQQRNEREYDKLLDYIEASFQDPANRKRWQSYDREMKISMANIMIADGIITFQIGKD